MHAEQPHQAIAADATTPPQPLTQRLTLPAWVLAGLLTGIALAFRSVNLADFFTSDESFHWIWRVQHFAGAVRQADWAGTNLTGHPGVTTLWLGTLGRLLALTQNIPTAGLAEGSAHIAYLAALRFPIVVVNSLSVGIGYLLMRRWLAAPVALLAALLWAGEPFLIAHSRLLHLDGLLTSMMTLTILTILVALDAPHRQTWAWLTLAGIWAGLALLTKGPALLLLPIVGLLLVLFGQPPSPPTMPAQWWQIGWRRIVWSIPPYLLWLAVAVLVFTSLWPVMWVDPQAGVARVWAEITGNGGIPHENGNYFWGQPVADPGPLFYPVVILWRSSAALLLGMLLVPLALRHSTGATRRKLLALLLYVGIFTLALSLLPKKFDRYLLPIFPTLAILAALGLSTGWAWLSAWLAHIKPTTAPVLPTLLTPLVALYLGLTALWYQPYYLAFFNPLLGGSATGQYMLLVGWGEGMPEIGAWLQQRPDVAQSPVLTADPRTLEAFVPSRVTYLNNTGIAQPASYAVRYIRNTQRQEAWPAQQFVSQAPPLFTFEKYGIPYATVHQPPRPFTIPVDATFGDGLHLRGYSLAPLETTLVLTPSWNVQTDQAGGWYLFVHLLAPNGQRVAQVDVPLDQGLFPTWQAGQQFGSPLPIGLPADLPPARYRIVLGLYDPASGVRLPLRTGTPLDPAINGADVLELTQIMLPISK